MKRALKDYQNINHLTHIFNTFNFSSTYSKTLARMQFKTKSCQWTTLEKNFSLMLFYKSPAAYKFLRKMGIVLPGVSSIRRWIGSSKFQPGFDHNLFKDLQRKFSTETYQGTACIISLDEMSIMRHLEYSKDLDLVEGFQDLGHLGRKPITANYALVFMIRGFYNWKFPVSYFLSHSGVKHENLCILLQELIALLEQAGLDPKMIVCDQGSSNRSMLKQLNVTPENPFFISNGKKIYAIFDVPHLFKSFRNNMLNGNFNLNGKIIRFEDIRRTYEIDKENKKSRMLMKLTHSHLQPDNFQKMNVKLAVQIFSHSVASAIRTCIGTDELQSDTAENTANFIEFMNNLFDTLNSRIHFSPNPYRCALSKKNPIVNETLEEASKVLTFLQKIDFKNGRVSTPPCFTGLVQTINAILQFFEEEQENGCEYLMTNRLNQDPLENLFSIYRQKGGYNRNPTARTLRCLFRTNVINSLMTPAEASNCEVDEDNILPIGDSAESTSNSEVCEIYLPSIDNAQCTGNTDRRTTHEKSVPEELITSEQCSVAYFAGYLANKCMKQHGCIRCKDSLTKQSKLTDKRELFILNKTYSNISDVSIGLSAPTAEFLYIADKCLSIFEKSFPDILHEKQLKSKILKYVMNDHEVSLWLQNETCRDHRIFILEHLIVCKLFYNCKMMFKGKSHNKYSKISKTRILENK